MSDDEHKGWDWFGFAKLLTLAGPLVTRVKSWINRSSTAEPTTPTPGILILGQGGTGKTTLAMVLSGDFAPSTGLYVESILIEHSELKDRPDTKITVLPGQEHRRGEWTAVLADLADGRYRGVIFVTAYGHSAISVASNQLRSKESDPEKALHEFTAVERKAEIQILKQVCASVLRSRTRTWFLTVVTKQDLWYPEAQDVVRHYNEGSYGRELKKLFDPIPKEQFRHETAFLSLIIENFVTADGKRLRPNAEGYDMKMHLDSVLNLFRILDGLRQWEEQA